MTIRRWRLILAVGTGAISAATGLTLALAGASAGAAPIVQTVPRGAAAAAPSGDNGTVKIHNSTTPVTDRRNEPHVCVFYLDAFGFDSGQSVSWQIRSWPPTGSRSVVASGSLILDTGGNGHTGDMSLQNGHYKLFWNFAGENGFAKQKVFWVKCPASPPRHRHKGKKPPIAPAPKPVSSNLPVTG